MLEAGIFDPYLVKHWGIKLATNAAITVLRVDQVSCYLIPISHQQYLSENNNNNFASIFVNLHRMMREWERIRFWI